MDDLEKEREELEAALEEAFTDPMIQLGTAVYDSREALPEVLQDDLKEAMGVKSELEETQTNQTNEQKLDLDRDQDF